MGFLDRFSKTDDSDGEDDDTEEEERELQHYQICHGGEDGGWTPIEGYKKLSFPMDEEEFRYNEEPLDPGRYTIFGVDQWGQRMKPDEDDKWRVKVQEDKPDRSSGSDRQFQQLQAQIEELKEQQQQPGQTPDDQLDSIKANLLANAVQNPQFMNMYGEKVFDWALGFSDTDESGRPGYDEWKDNPFAAIAYDMSTTAMHEPHKMRKMGENLGGGLGAFIDGAAEGALEPPVTDEDSGEDVDETPESPMSTVEGGPGSLDDLEAAQEQNNEDLAKEIEQDIQNMRGSEEEPDSEGDSGPVTHSEVEAGPEVADQVERDLDPERCQYVKDDGEQCQNPPTDDSDYCHVESHRDETEETEQLQESQDDEPNEESMTEEITIESDDDEPSPEEVADGI